jgi:hypothetical protein
MEKINPERYGLQTFSYTALKAMELMYGIKPGDDNWSDSFPCEGRAGDPYMNNSKFTDEEIRKLRSIAETKVSQLCVTVALHLHILISFCIRLRSYASERILFWD